MYMYISCIAATYSCGLMLHVRVSQYMYVLIHTQYNQEYNELFREAGLPPKRRLMQMRVSPCAKIQPGKLPAGMHT